METRDELDELKRLRSENKALKEAYAELVLNHKCSEKVIEVADEMFNLDLKKSTNTSYQPTSGGRSREPSLSLLRHQPSSLLQEQ